MGYKVFNPDFTCRGFQYEVGKTYETELNPDVCKRGFHFCKKAIDCFDYYNFNPANKVAEIIALGAVAEEGNKCATNKIQIVREIPWAELLDIVNTGEGNTGHSNSGNSNSGHWNSGNSNSGDRNSGHWNSGHWNSGNSNSGDRNSGHWNSGDRNGGYRNSGNSNSGHSNSGNSNSGHSNSGNWNSGNRNSGNRNSGHWNQGDFCTGDFNTTDHETGCFCTEEHSIRFFDKETEMTFREWRNSKAYNIICSIPFKHTTWILADDMTDDEKAAHPNYKTTDGYLRINDADGAFQTWWEFLTENEKEIIKDIPNFNAEKFKRITGIEV